MSKRKSPEARFRKELINAFSEDMIERVENNTSFPDIVWIDPRECARNSTAFIELKVMENGKAKIRKGQYAWLKRCASYGGLAGVLCKGPDYYYFWNANNLEVQRYGDKHVVPTSAPDAMVEKIESLKNFVFPANI